MARIKDYRDGFKEWLNAPKAGDAKCNGMRTPLEISRTPALLLTDEEIDTLGPEEQKFVRRCKELHEKEVSRQRADQQLTQEGK